MMQELPRVFLQHKNKSGSMIVHHIVFSKGREVRIQRQQRLYHKYALAAEAYVKKPTIYNWEKKEKAFETYNALIKNFKKEEQY